MAGAPAATTSTSRAPTGPGSGFLFGWAQLVAILTGSIGAMAYVFADYGVALFSGGDATAIAAGGRARRDRLEPARRRLGTPRRRTR